MSDLLFGSILAALVATQPLSPAPSAPEQETWFEIEPWKLASRPQHGGGWLKQICSDPKFEETCASYMWGVIDTLDTWPQLETKYFLIKRNYGEILQGLKTYLDSLSLEEADKLGAPELVQQALEERFPL